MKIEVPVCLENIADAIGSEISAVEVSVNVESAL